MQLTPEALELADFMEMISEDCYCAGWVGDLEFALWEIVQKGEAVEFGKGEITINDIARLKQFSDAAGGWIRWDEINFRGFVAMTDWFAMYSDYVSNPENRSD